MNIIYTIAMRSVYKSVQNIFHEICGRPPTSNELHVYSQFFISRPNHLYDHIFTEHIKQQARKYEVYFKNDDVKESAIDIKGARLLVVGLVRNIENNILYVKKLIQDLREHCREVCFYFYHNNSTDTSIDILKDWMSQDKNISGTFAPNTTITIIDNVSQKIGNRIPMFARMRNENISKAIEHFGVDFDYMLMTNTDFISEIDITGIIKSLTLNEPWSIICGNCCFQYTYMHYDAYALRTLEDPTDIRAIYPNFDKYYGKNSLWLDKLYIFDGWTRVKSGYGDMCILKMPALLEYYNKSGGQICKVDNDNPHTCELISMCEGVSGNIWISPYIVYPATVKLEIEPFCFIPRDAGFFSVLNFFIGALFSGQRLYPYYNKKMFDRYHKENKHFCYWSEDNENSWFEYFEPISFYHGDTTHLSDNFFNYKITHGEAAGGEFRYPGIYKKLLCNTDIWTPWRHTVHSIFKKYVTVKADILSDANEFWTSINGSAKDFIGVHYRHPSHYVESGKVFLRDYFAKIDEILAENANAQIYLSTDNELGLMAFSYRYKNRVHYIPDIHRVEVDNILEWAHEKKGNDMDFIDGKGYQLHYTVCGASGTSKAGVASGTSRTSGTKVGKDVLKEVLCLAKCKWLVHIISNVALAVSYFNPAIDMRPVLGGSIN